VASPSARLALLAFLAALVVLSFVHTDDGCVVERHCLACSWALSPAAGVQAPVSVAPVLEWVGTVAIEATAGPQAHAPLASVSRGPPAA
jgi:hypothetical protein